jgi:hypothetical protein
VAITAFANHLTPHGQCSSSITIPQAQMWKMFTTPLRTGMEAEALAIVQHHPDT